MSPAPPAPAGKAAAAKRRSGMGMDDMARVVARAEQEQSEQQQAVSKSAAKRRTTRNTRKKIPEVVDVGLSDDEVEEKKKPLPRSHSPAPLPPQIDMPGATEIAPPSAAYQSQSRRARGHRSGGATQFGATLAPVVPVPVADEDDAPRIGSGATPKIRLSARGGIDAPAPKVRLSGRGGLDMTPVQYRTPAETPFETPNPSKK